MIIVSGSMKVKEDGIDQFRKAAEHAVAATLKEEGCGTYGFYQSISDPTLFQVYEEWESKDALRAHAAAPHLATFRDQVASVVVARDVKMIEPERIKPL